MLDDATDTETGAEPASEGTGGREPAWDGFVSLISRTFGIHRLRPLQEEAMRANLAGRDLVLVLPTGGGKSLCYQAPALYRAGLTVVVSPLISLMKDQVDGLLQNGVRAAMLASVQDSGERQDVHRALEAGELDLLFVAPERLMMDGFFERLLALGLSGIAVDEAHCISHWGHDFRPEYRQIGDLKRRAPHVPIHAFTATATERVCADVAQLLSMDDPVVLIGHCDRPNLTYRVQPRRELTRQVLEVIERHPGRAGIVYCISRREVERIAQELRTAGVKSSAYHAGLGGHVRKRVQDDFLNEEIDVVVATVAFGMGIDRTDVRFVIHAAMPKGVEQYSQETGRAGRDGLPSECVLFHSGTDYFSWKSMLERGHEEARAEGKATSQDVLDATIERLGQMMNYTSRFVCRHKQLVEYFGQTWTAKTGGCGACDVCLGEIRAIEDSLVTAQKILSAVVRCDQRYGSAHVTAVLRGADTAAIRRAGHQELTTYGILKNASMAAVRGWIDQLVGQEHLRVSGDRYPILYLSQSGVEVMRGERDVTLFAVPERKGAKKRGRTTAHEDLGEDVDEQLFESLRELRRELARERGVPPYLIFNDKTLAGLAAAKPKTPAEFLAMRGVGEKKAADLGPAFLERIANHRSEPGSV